MWGWEGVKGHLGWRHGVGVWFLVSVGRRRRRKRRVSKMETLSLLRALVSLLSCFVSFFLSLLFPLHITHHVFISPHFLVSLCLSLSLSLPRFIFQPSFLHLLFSSPNTHTAGGGTDFVYFHRLHDDVETHLATQCSVWKEKSESLEALIQEETQSQEDAAHLVEGLSKLLCTYIVKSRI